jgi:hypothetical protein
MTGTHIPTAAIREEVMEAVEAMEIQATNDEKCGRLGESNKWKRRVWVVEEYVRTLENSVRAARQTIKALEGR